MLSINEKCDPIRLIFAFVSVPLFLSFVSNHRFWGPRGVVLYCPAFPDVASFATDFNIVLEGSATSVRPRYAPARPAHHTDHTELPLLIAARGQWVVEVIMMYQKNAV